MKILVTGATGYLGSELIKHLKGDIRILTRRKDVKIKNCEIFRGDITNLHDVKNAVKDVDIIYHNAALVDHFAPYETLYKINVLGTKNIMDAALKEGVKKIVYTSTVAVTDKIKDNYCLTKQMAEQLVKSYWKEIAVSIIRPAPIYDEKRIEFLKKIRIPMIKENLTLHLVYKKSVIEAIINAGKRGKPRVYTIADKGPVKLFQLYDIICKARNYRSIFIPKFTLTMAYGIAKTIETCSKTIGMPYPLYTVMKTMIGQDRIYDPLPAVKELKYRPVNTLNMFYQMLRK